MSSSQKTPSNNPFLANGHATLIGSIPLSSHDEALDLIFTYTPTIPLWPQLPGNSNEGMLVQFNEGLPAIDSNGPKIFFNTSSEHYETEQLSFYEEYLFLMENNADILSSRFQMSHTYGQGIYRLIERSNKKENILALKGQITGPFTLLTGICDQENRAGYYDPMIREMITKGLALKAAWQTAFLKKYSKNVIIFIDEPALAGLGSSSFISISREDIIQDQTEMIDAVHRHEGLAGIHVCANTDWSLLLSLPYDILNFDAYGYFDKLVSCKNEIYSFLERDGIIAWGIVPTSEEEHIVKETPDSLVNLWESQARQLADNEWTLSRILQQSLITPSCGTGALTPELATRVLHLTCEVSRILQDRYL